MTSAIVLLMVTCLVIWCWRATKKGDWARVAALFAGGFLAIEALLGAALVLLNHVAHDQSAGRVLFLCLHLGNTLLLLASLSLTAAWLSNRGRSFTFIRNWQQVTAISLGLLTTMATGMTGAVAALADTLFPVTSLRRSLAEDSGSGASPLLHFRLLHPAVAALATYYLVWVIVRSSTRQKRFSRHASALIILIFVQVGIGALNILLFTPVWLQISHLLVADVLWIFLVLASVDLMFVPDKGHKVSTRGSNVQDA